MTSRLSLSSQGIFEVTFDSVVSTNTKCLNQAIHLICVGDWRVAHILGIGTCQIQLKERGSNDLVFNSSSRTATQHRFKHTRQKKLEGELSALLYTSTSSTTTTSPINAQSSSRTRRSTRISLAPPQRKQRPYISNILQRLQKGYQMK